MVAPDVTRLAQVCLSLNRAIPHRRIGACEVPFLADHDLAHVEDWSAYVRLDLCFECDLSAGEIESLLSVLPFKAYRIEKRDVPISDDCSILDFDWSDVLPNLDWLKAA